MWMSFFMLCCTAHGRVLKILPVAKRAFESMKPDAKIFEDLTRMAGGAMNVFSGLREQILNDVKARMDDMAARLDLVPREDFDRLEAQVKELRKQVEELKGGASAPARKTLVKKRSVAKKKPAAGKKKA